MDLVLITLRACSKIYKVLIKWFVVSWNTASMIVTSFDVESVPQKAVLSLQMMPAPTAALPRFTVPAHTGNLLIELI